MWRRCTQGSSSYGVNSVLICYSSLSTTFGSAELAPRTRRVVIDLSGVEMIDAAGLGELVSVAVAAQSSGCSITLAALGHFIRQLLELTKLTSVLELYPTLDAATLAFSGQAAKIASAEF